MADPKDMLLAMMGRLQQAVSGESASTINTTAMPVAAATRRARRVTTAVALVLNQALARHAAFSLPQSRRARIDNYLARVVAGAGELAMAAGSDSSLAPSEVLRTENWTNQAAEQLERQRLSSIFHLKDSELTVLIDTLRSAAHHGTSAEDVALPNGVSPFTNDSADAVANPDGSLPKTPIQWPCSTEFHVLFGPLASADGKAFRQLSVRNATDDFVLLAHNIHQNPYDVTAWRKVLQRALDMPISQCRSVWELACFLFPTCGPLVVSYVQREMRELEGNPTFSDSDDVHVAKEMYVARLRVLNVFARHLPLCSSPALWLLLLKDKDGFVSRFITGPVSTLDADRTVDAMFRVALEKSVGCCVDATDLWAEYIRWRSAKTSSTAAPAERALWVRKMYLRVLVMPIEGLARLRADFDLVEGKDQLGNPKKQDDDTELRMKAALQMGVERQGKFDPMLRCRLLSEAEEQELAPDDDVNEPFFPIPFTAHRPPGLRGAESTMDGNSGGSGEDAEVSRMQAALLLRWRDIIASEKDVNMSGSRLPQAHAQRVQFFLTMQCHYFPHVATTWLDAAQHAAVSFPHEQLRDRVQRVRAIYDEALLFLPGSPLLLCAYAEFLMRERVDDLRAGSELLALRAKRLAKAAGDDVSGEAVEQLVVLYVNWMRWVRSYAPTATAAPLTRLVAKHAVVDTGLLLLIMTVAKRFIKEKPAGTFLPTRHFRAFNLFCSAWLRLEVLGLRDAAMAVRILQSWCSHLARMVATTTAQQWTLRMCGVDETLLAACRLVCATYPSHTAEVLTSLHEILASDGVALPTRHRSSVVELAWIRQLLHAVDPALRLCQQRRLQGLLDVMDLGAIDAADFVDDWAEGVLRLGSAVADFRHQSLPSVPPGGQDEPLVAQGTLCAVAVPSLAVMVQPSGAALCAVGDTPAPAASVGMDMVTPMLAVWPRLAPLPDNPRQLPGSRPPRRTEGRPQPYSAYGRGPHRTFPHQQQQQQQQNQEDPDPIDDEMGDQDDDGDGGGGGVMASTSFGDARGSRRKALVRLSRGMVAQAAMPKRRALQHTIDVMLLEHCREAVVREGVDERARKRIRLEGGAVSPPPSAAAGGVDLKRNLALQQQLRRQLGRRDYAAHGGGSTGSVTLAPIAALLRALPAESELASHLLPPPSPASAAVLSVLMGSTADEADAGQAAEGPALAPGRGLDVSTRFLIDTLWAISSLRPAEAA